MDLYVLGAKLNLWYRRSFLASLNVNKHNVNKYGDTVIQCFPDSLILNQKSLIKFDNFVFQEKICEPYSIVFLSRPIDDEEKAGM